jgi:hypothetical protein
LSAGSPWDSAPRLPSVAEFFGCLLAVVVTILRAYPPRILRNHPSP